MRTNFFRLLLISLAALVLFGCQEQKQEDPKSTTPIAVINNAKIFQESSNGKASQEYIASVMDKLNQELIVLGELVEKEKNKEKAQTMREKGVMEIQQRFQDEQFWVDQKFTELYTQAVKEIKEEIGATLIFSSDMLMDYDEKVDITDLVLKKIDKEPISFTEKNVDDKATDEAATEDKTNDAQDPAQEKAADDKNAEDKNADKVDAKADAKEKATEPSGK